MTYQKYYFTFTCYHRLSDYVQPIVAPSMRLAMTKMFDMYGKDWAVDFTSEEYNHRVLNGMIEQKKELETVVV